jgi:hypothetical protein
VASVVRAREVKPSEKKKAADLSTGRPKSRKQRRLIRPC